MRRCKERFLQDIYYTKEYISLYLQPDEEIFEFAYRQENKCFYNIAIKRPIKFLDNTYYDLESVYGYGGYYVNIDDIMFLKQVFVEYEKKCLEENIVAEFIRFHPFLQNIKRYQYFLDFIEKNRDTIYVDLDNQMQYHSSLKRNLRKIEPSLKFSLLHDKKEYLEEFIDLYYMTMKKNRASNFYFFPRAYFEKLFLLKEMKLFGVQYQGKWINFIITLESPHLLIAYYHLGATHSDYYSLNVNPFVFDRIIHYYQKKRYNIFYLGGGQSCNDNLFRFKKKFSPLRRPFYIGGKIFDEEKYRYLKQKFQCKSNLFLSWRSYEK